MQHRIINLIYLLLCLLTHQTWNFPPKNKNLESLILKVSLHSMA